MKKLTLLLLELEAISDSFINDEEIVRISIMRNENRSGAEEDVCMAYITINDNGTLASVIVVVEDDGTIKSSQLEGIYDVLVNQAIAPREEKFVFSNN